MSSLVHSGPPPVELTAGRSQFRTTLARVFGVDVRALAAFRMAVATLVVLDLLLRARDLTAHYTADGVVPGDTYLQRWATAWHPSIHFLNDTVWYQSLLFLLAGAAACAMLLGYRTRWATGLSWFLLISLQARNPYVLQGGDVTLRLLLFWGMFLPLGRVWSLDARRQGAEAPGYGIVAGAPTAALLLQVAIMYWFSSASKCNAIWFTDQTALYVALNMDDVTSTVGRQLLQLGALLPLCGIGVVIFEGVWPFLAFSPVKSDRLRMIAAVPFIAMHAGFAVCFHIGLFSYIMMAAWIPFLPATIWDRWDKKGVAPARSADRDTSAFGMLSQAACAVLVCFVFVWNVRTVAPEFGGRLLPPGSDTVANVLRIDQIWNMFALPYRDDGWWLAAADLPDGRTVDLLRGGIAVSEEKPYSVAQSYPTYRWRKYLRNLWDFRETDQRRMHTALGEFLCTRWNRTHTELEQVAKVDLIFMVEYTPDPGGAFSITPVVVMPYRCGLMATPNP